MSVHCTRYREARQRASTGTANLVQPPSGEQPRNVIWLAPSCRITRSGRVWHRGRALRVGVGSLIVRAPAGRVVAFAPGGLFRCRDGRGRGPGRLPLPRLGALFHCAGRNVARMRGIPLLVCERVCRRAARAQGDDALERLRLSWREVSSCAVRRGTCRVLGFALVTRELGE